MSDTQRADALCERSFEATVNGFKTAVLRVGKGRK